MAAMWNDMAARARNSTFLFHRDYMDYHADRFTDCSLMAWRKGKPVALLPANIADDELYSHQGLTYGGWILPRGIADGTAVMELFETLAGWCRAEGIARLHYKPLPYIYAEAPAQEDIYALWRLGASIESVLLSSCADLQAPVGFDYLRRRYLKRTESAGVRVEEAEDYASFWRMLEECLAERHDAIPVHTLQEMERLHSLFPRNIRLFMAMAGERPLAGTLIYDSERVAHCQYIASTSEGRTLRALPYLFHELMERVFASRRYFDFGTSNEGGGRVLNAGLLANKFGYGASGVACQQFTLDLR